jgi:hypothetical protein
MAKFMYLFRHQHEGRKQPSPEEMQRLMKSWMSWLDDVKKDGHLVSTGERLDGAGKVVRGRAKAVTDGPYAEAKDTIGGYMVVEARDLAEAVELSKGCPILESDGCVEVRAIISM